MNANHRFLDEAGDTTFYGKGKLPLLGTDGVSKYFILGISQLHEELEYVRRKIRMMQDQVANDPYLHEIPSIAKKVKKNGYYFHAKDDVPEVRKIMFEFIKNLKCEFKAVVARKEYDIYEKKYNGRQTELYTDLLSRIIPLNLVPDGKLIFNVAHRSQCTTQLNFLAAVQKAKFVTQRRSALSHENNQIVFNIQYPTTEPIISIVDYFLWATQRKYEKGESRFANFLDNQIATETIMNFDETLAK